MEPLEGHNHLGDWVKEKYQKVQKLLQTIKHEKCDSNKTQIKESEALNILNRILTKLEHCEEKRIFCTVATAITYLNLGILKIDNKTCYADDYFKKCIELLEDIKLTPEGILPAISVNNQMGLFYAECYREKAQAFLKQAESLYIKFTEEVELEPIYLLPIMGIEEIEGNLCAKSILEKLHTLTLYYLAQVYEELEDKSNFALYCHRTLSKQLSQNKITQDLDYVDWALNAATISQYFIEQNKFPAARHHLAAATYILDKYSEILKAKGSRETNEILAAEYENYDDRSADIARCWAKYGIALMEASKKRLLSKAEQEDQDSKPTKVSNENGRNTQTDIMEDPRFVDLEPELESITSEITDKYLLDFNDARPVFLNVRKWLDKAKKYYTFENHASDYAYVALDFSQAFMYLAFFEDDEDRQARMHKRRIHILEEINNELSPRFYKSICNEIWLELAQTYSEILDLKMDRLQAYNEKPTIQMVGKIEHLAKCSIKHYQSYLDSLGMNKSETGIESFQDDLLYSVLHTYFYIGRLYNKIITFDMKKKVENMQNSINAYSFVVNYYNNHPEQQEMLDKYEFITLSKEFVTLLPLTLNRLRQQQMNQQ